MPPAIQAHILQAIDGTTSENEMSCRFPGHCLSPPMAALFILLAAFAPTAARAAELRAADPQLVFLDNDFAGPGGSDIQSLLPLIDRPGIRLLGLGVVTGDAWRAEESAHLRRFLEIAGQAAVPVYLGAESPLLRTQSEMRGWEQHYGRLLWKGAWNARGRANEHADQPELIPPMPEGQPTLQPAAETAMSAMIRLVRAHPHQVTIIAAGPMTDLALAIRQAPDLPALARQLVFMGALLDTSVPQLDAEAAHRIDYYTDFNMIFDPEAAHIVLTSAWPRITVLGTVTLTAVTDKALLQRVAAQGSAISGYVARYAVPGTPFWDEMAAAVAVDPGLVTRELTAAMDIDIVPGPDYGRAHVWPANLAPHQGEQIVHIVQAVDVPRFLDGFVTETGLGPRAPR